MGFSRNSSSTITSLELGGAQVKNEMVFQGGMTSENGYPQQGGYGKFLEKPNKYNKPF